MNITLQQAKQYFRESLVAQDPSAEQLAAINRCQWQVFDGVPHLISHAGYGTPVNSMHFVECKCGQPHCKGVTSQPGIIH